MSQTATWPPVIVNATVDSVRIGNSATGPFLLVNPDGSINVDATNPSVGLNTDPAPLYSTQVGGQDANGDLQALTTTLNYNNKELLNAASPDVVTSSTVIGALNDAVQLSMQGLTSVGFQINSGSFIGTLTPQGSIDGGTTWANTSFYDPASTSVTPNITFTAPNTTKVLSILPLGGASLVRVVATAYTSGSASSLLRASEVSGSIGAISVAAFGSVSNTYPTLVASVPTLILPANPARKYAYFSNVSGSQMQIQFGSSTGLNAITGLIIPITTFYELRGDNLYTGDIYAFSADPITIAVTEGTP